MKCIFEFQRDTEKTNLRRQFIFAMQCDIFVVYTELGIIIERITSSANVTKTCMWYTRPEAGCNWKSHWFRHRSLRVIKIKSIIQTMAFSLTTRCGTKKMFGIFKFVESAISLYNLLVHKNSCIYYRRLKSHEHCRQYHWYSIRISSAQFLCMERSCCSHSTGTFWFSKLCAYCCRLQYWNS